MSIVIINMARKGSYMNLCDSGTIRSLMEKYGLRFKKEFGQNFLTNIAIPERIADECTDIKESGILEIGPGVGCLTNELAKRYKKVVAVEIDRGLIPLLAETLGKHENCRVIEGDIMELDLEKLISDEFGDMPVSVCANLPYYITTPILMRLLESEIPFRTVTVMIQAEVADRLAAAPGSADYGAITAVLGYYGSVKKLFTVGPGCFNPPPKVSSSVVQITLYENKPYKPLDRDLFFKLIKLAFGQRRKTLLNTLSGGFPELSKDDIADAVTSLGFKPDIRGERLSTADYCALSDVIHAKLEK